MFLGFSIDAWITIATEVLPLRIAPEKTYFLTQYYMP